LILPILRPACAHEAYVALWLSIIGATIVAVGMVTGPPHWLLLATVIVAGFDAVRWTVSTGNIAVLEIFLSSVGIASLAAGRFVVFAATVGSAAFVKWIPAVLALLAVPLAGLRGVARALLAVLAVVALLNVLYLLWMPGLFAAYWSSIAHALFSFFRAEAVYGAEVHPSLLSFLMGATSTTIGRSWPGLVLYGAAAAFVAFDLIRVTRQSRDPAQLLPLWGLGLLLLMPRMKPYGFGVGLVPLYLGALSLQPLPQVLLVLVSCIVPLAGVLVSDRSVASAAAYSQLYALAGAYAVLRVATGSRSPVGDILLQSGENIS
jgi:hypothetical protein